MALSLRSVWSGYLIVLVLLASVVVGRTDPSQQHPITATDPPGCMTLAHSTDDCNFTNTTISQCTYDHCHVDLGLVCADTWLVLDLNCVCNGLGTAHCSDTCHADLPWVAYLNWISETCTVIPDWPGLPSDTSLELPNSAQIMPTDLHINTPACIAGEDSLAFQACYVTTYETSLDSSTPEKPRLFSLDMSQPYQLDLTCFCGNFSFNDTMDRSTCTADTVAQSEAYIWLNTYCGAYNNFQQQQMPLNWQDSLLVANDTYVITDNLQTSWSTSTASDECSGGFDSLVSRCDAGSRCQSVTDCNSPVATTDMHCFCAEFPTDNTVNDGWCGSDRISFARSLLWYEKTCKADAKGFPAAQLLPWTDQLHSSDFVVDEQTNLAVASASGCPSIQWKLGSFAVVNALMATFIPILGRRTIINKITFGWLGQSRSISWPFTGLFGVGLHLGSNAVNAKIIQNTQGFEQVSIKHLVFLWCTRPRLGWLVVAFVPWQANKAMYFSVAASTLITEFVLQLFGAAYMGIATNYGRKAYFYSGRNLKDYVGAQSLDAQIMYAGCLLCLIVFSFALIVCGWSVLNINNHVRSLSTYLTGMEATCRKQRIIATIEEGSLAGLASDEALSLERHSHGDVRWHQENLRVQCTELVTSWQALHTYTAPISQELRRDRKQRVREVERRVEDEGWEPDQEMFDSAWFLDPPRRAGENRDAVSNAQDALQRARGQRDTLLAQIAAKETDVNALRVRQKRYRQLLDELDATANLIGSRRSTRRFTAGLFGFGRRQSLDSETPRQLSREDQQRRHQAYQSHAETENKIYTLNHIRDRLFMLRHAYDEIEKSWTKLAESRETLAADWDKVARERRQEAEAAKKKKSFVGIPLVVLGGMLVTWVAQWMWWIGYVRVARDTYCPPKLGALTAVWTMFSASGATVGASF